MTGYRTLAETLDTVAKDRGKLAKIARLAETLTSAPAVPFASRIACRSEPAAESFVLVTGKVAAREIAAFPRTQIAAGAKPFTRVSG